MAPSVPPHRSRTSPLKIALAFALGIGAALLTAACGGFLARGGLGPTQPAVNIPNLVDPAQSWAFTPEPDRFSPEALLDLRYLNEAQAGESGFIGRSADGEDFITGDGTPIRFWPVNTGIWRQPPAAMAEQARFLAKRGVNLVRWHGQIPSQAAQTPLRAIDETARDQLWHLVAAMKQEGIYTSISPYFAAFLPPQPQWGVPRDSDTMMGLLFFDPVVQEAYQTWWRALLEPVNPYTGIPLKDDPAVAFLHLQNEDSLLFWTLQSLQGKDLDLLLGQYGDWLLAKYGSGETILQAWGGSTLAGDDPTQGRWGLLPIWDMTQPVTDSGRGQRLADQTEFLTTTMVNFNRRMVEFLRQDLGVKALINANNWKTADSARLNDAERYSYTPAEVMAVNRYYGGVHSGEHSGWAIVAGDRFTDPSVLRHPDQLPTNLKQVRGYPMVITESSWVPPLGYQSEGPFLVSLFQSLTGIDGFAWFIANSPQWQQPDSANGYLPSLGKWIVDTPELLGNFPAAALIYRQGYLQRGTPVVEEHRPLDHLWQRRLPLLAETASFDPNRDLSRADNSGSETQVHPLAFLVGPVKVTYAGDPAQDRVVDLRPYIDDRHQTLTSITGEITWDYGQGLCRLDSPKAQGVTGFLKDQGPITLHRLTITSGNPYATVIVASMDGQPLDQAQRILVQVGTAARSTGWQQKPTRWTDENGTHHQGYEVLNYGTAPWRVANADVTLDLNYPGIRRAQRLDMNGMAQEDLPLEGRGQGVRLRLPATARYVVLSRGQG